MTRKTAPLDDAIMAAMCDMIDDAMVESRRPTHDQLSSLLQRAGLRRADPRERGETWGKAKRLRAVLEHAIENDLQAGERLVWMLLQQVKGVGGFRPESENHVGSEAIQNAAGAFRAAGFALGSDGDLGPLLLDGLSGAALTDALKGYVRRAKRGSEDAALVAGTGKDLIEACAWHVLVSTGNPHSAITNFPTLLALAFTELGWATDAHPIQPEEHARTKLERAMFATALAVNTLRNKEGSGHGRPFPPDVKDSEAKAAIEFMGTIAERMLEALASR